MSQQTVTINGKLYDAHTGMPVGTISQPQAQSHTEPARPSKPRLAHSHDIHHATQKSQTLNRRVVKKAPQHSAGAHADIRPRKSSAISKFAPHPSGKIHAIQSTNDIGPRPHPLAQKAAAAKPHQVVRPATTPTRAALTPKPSQTIKQEAIQDALEKAPSHAANHEEVKQPRRRASKFLGIASASLALLLLGGYFTYLNMPSLSVRVAAAQAGVNASYPEYRPDGYSLRGPIAFGDGEVLMKFAANGGPQNFTISQTKSDWDSSAVLDNYVKEKAGDNYIAYNERGLTIYTFGGNAAWVNGGVLYTLEGDAPLSGDQIRRIATSM